MSLVLSVLLVGLGLTLAVRTLLKPATPDQVFPRFGAPKHWNARLVTVITGVGIALVGVVLLLLLVEGQGTGPSP